MLFQADRIKYSHITGIIPFPGIILFVTRMYFFKETNMLRRGFVALNWKFIGHIFFLFVSCKYTYSIPRAAFALLLKMDVCICIRLQIVFYNGSQRKPEKQETE